MVSEAKRTGSADRVKELSEQLRQGVNEVFSSGKYADYLGVMSRFHQYSPRNSMAIFLQNPEATRVAGFNTWKSLGRSVNRGEKGLQILAPAPYKKAVEVTQDEDGKPLAKPQSQEITCLAFKIAYVFDVSQTSGKELPRLAERLTGEVGEYDRLLRALRSVSPYPISFERIDGTANGYCDYAAQRIVIREGASQEQAVKTAIHEIAHAILHDPKRREDRQTIEVQAESVAYIVCQQLGVDSSQYSFGYVAGWSAGKELAVLEDSLAVIRDGAARIIERLEAELERAREHEKGLAERMQDAPPLGEKQSAQPKDPILGTRREAEIKQLATRIETFLSHHDPAYRYSPSIPGWSNQEQAVQSFTQNLLTLDAAEFQWLQDRLEEIGEGKPLFRDAAERLIEEINKHFKQYPRGTIMQESPAPAPIRPVIAGQPKQPPRHSIKEKLAEARQRCDAQRAEAPEKPPARDQGQER